MSSILIYLTCTSKDEARMISQELVAKQLVACANIYPSVNSIYQWEGELCEEEEVAVIFKSMESHYPEIQERIKELHSYTCPCIIVLPITQGNPDFLEWIEDSCINAK